MNGTPYRLAATFESGVARKLYIDGALDTTDTCGAQPADLDRFVMGNADNGDAAIDGAIGQMFLASGLKSVEFIKADYDNLNTPATFVTMAAV